MKSLKTILVFLILSGITSSAFGSSLAELKLWKHDPFFYGSCGHCGDFYRFKPNRDRSNFTDFNLYLQSGYYSVVLDGPARTVVTLFGAQNFNTKRGYLIIVKKDDSIVQVPDLEDFDPGQWIDQDAKEGWSGAFSVFYAPCKNFKNNVASVKWGKWGQDWHDGILNTFSK